jgi:hypothetical protein
MLKMLIYFSLVCVVYSQSTQLKSFDELYETLMNGNDVNIVIKYGMTKLIIDREESKAPDAIGGMELSTYEYFAPGVVRNDKAYISCSETVLINHPFYGVVYNYAKLRIYEDDTVEITAQYLDPITYEIKMDEKFITIFNNGENDGGVYFYKN